MGKSLKDRVDDWIHRSYMYPIAHSLEAILLTQRDEVYSMERPWKLGHHTFHTLADLLDLSPSR